MNVYIRIFKFYDVLDGYPHFAARKLKVQVQNKGLSGACHIEKEMVDFIVDDCKWDFATCELGVNMRFIYTPEEFKKRALYFINQLTNTRKPVLIISVFPNKNTSSRTASPSLVSERENAYNNILDDLVKKRNASNVHFINGYEVLDDFTGLSGDLLHPCKCDHGS